jgi:signal transduction histidine kinase
MQLYALGALGLVVAQSCLIALLMAQRARRRRAEMAMRSSQAELRTSFERIRDLGRRLLKAQEAERSRIARELHDDVGQKLALVLIDLQMLGGFGAGEPDMRIPLERTSDRVRDIATSIHDLAHRLHPVTLGLMGLVPALRSLPNDFMGVNVMVTFSVDEASAAAIPADVTLALFRITQEAVQNAAKHSGAREIVVHLRANSEGIVLAVTDDGSGFDVEAALGRGLGLIGMRERVDSIGATLTIRSLTGQGTRLEVSLPAVAAVARIAV